MKCVFFLLMVTCMSVALHQGKPNIGDPLRSEEFLILSSRLEEFSMQLKHKEYETKSLSSEIQSISTQMVEKDAKLNQLENEVNFLSTRLNDKETQINDLNIKVSNLVKDGMNNVPMSNKEKINEVDDDREGMHKTLCGLANKTLCKHIVY